MKQYKGHLFAGIFLLLIILGMGFATALGAPTGAHFEDNVSADADNNGIFTVNWTSPGAGVQNYSIFVYVNGSFSASYLNNSVTGRSFVNNTEETNYTYHIAASQANGTLTANSTNISIFIDGLNEPEVGPQNERILQNFMQGKHKISLFSCLTTIANLSLECELGSP